MRLAVVSKTGARLAGMAALAALVVLAALADPAPARAQADAAEPPAASADEGVPAELRDFFADIDTIRGEFLQVMFDARGRAVERSQGEFAILKPGRFRWHYTDPYEQLIVADGENIWLYDVDFEQVTVREQTDSLSHSPAMLLGGDANALDAFRYLGSYSRGGRDWLRLEPASAESDFRAVDLSFAGGELELMELTDALGQITRIEFTELVLNESLDDALFTFTPPAGVDVIGVGESSAAAPTAAGNG